MAADPVKLLAARLAQTEARLALTEARLDLYGLEGRYARTWDSGDAQEWADLFTDEGVFEMAAVGGDPGRRVEGRRDLAAFCTEYTATVSGLHLLHLPEITLEGNRPTSRLHFEFRAVLRDAPDLTQQSSVTGYYDTTYVLYRSGWRIARRHEKAVTRQRAVFYDL